MYFALTGDNPRFFRENKIPSHLLPPILKALAKEPAERWQTAKEFQQAIMAAVPSVKPSKPGATESGMWRCEWCHTSNPLQARFCSECGWDGQRLCPECESQTRVGVRFCPACGADIKQFEEVRRLLSTIHENVAQKNYPMVLTQADSVRGFRARGQPGQELIEQVGQARETAQRALNLMGSLAERIDQAVQVGNYELASQCIAEYDDLSDDDRYAELKEDLPAKVRQWRVSKELAQAKKMIGVRNWEGAERCCRRILREFNSSHPETRSILRRVMMRRHLRRLGLAAAVCAAVLLVYVLSMFPALAWARRAGVPEATQAIENIYAPVLKAHARGGAASAVLDRFGTLVGVPVVETENSP